ncbi:hypothetical protein OESDEN_22792 [Oesophagostomum dentatum]|uniref:PABS domain-containing protein n=1 Tax=Oesophagostomum dentatum TaxID=61180 RepID=A0A0B1RWX2_OESDE|nr:hypothetical protein OESDEN_22792 [Oesophagostomum dentatum]
MFLSGAVEMRKGSEARVLVLGMGGGFMNSFLHHNFPQMNITAVEIEPKMAEIAKKWFDLKLDRRHHLHIGDAMEFVRDAVAQGVLPLSDKGCKSGREAALQVVVAYLT